MSQASFFGTICHKLDIDWNIEKIDNCKRILFIYVFIILRGINNG